MPIRFCIRAGVIGAALCLPWGPVALGDTPGGDPAAPPGALFDAPSIDPAELDTQRGREGLNIEDVVMQLNDVHTDASVANNVLTSQNTGGNLVEAGAFGNAAGLVFNVQNSGNHVIIQNTTLINVNMQP